MLYFAISSGIPLMMLRLYIVLGPIKLVKDCGCRWKDCTLTTFSTSSISFPLLLSWNKVTWYYLPMMCGYLHLRMNLSIMPKSTNAKTSPSKTEWVLMILTLLNLALDFENMYEKILIGPVIPTFNEVFSWLFCHSSKATQSLQFENPPCLLWFLSLAFKVILEVDTVAIEEEDNVVIAYTATRLATPVSMPNSMTDLCTPLMWPNLPKTQTLHSISRDSSLLLSWGVIIVPNKYLKYLYLTQAIKSAFVASFN